MSITGSAWLDLDHDGLFEEGISSYLLEARITQGRSRSLEHMAPTRATVKLNNHDGRFSPKNTLGDYYPDFHERNTGIRIRAGSDLREFRGYITRIYQSPDIDEQAVILECTDRLGLVARQLISAGRFRQQPVHLILNRILDLLEKGEQVTNPGGEDLDGDGAGSLAGWSASAASGTTVASTNSMAFEGDYSLEAICDGQATAQGLRYDLGAEKSGFRNTSVFVRLAPGDGPQTLTFRGLNASLVQQWYTNIAVLDTGWVYFKGYGLAANHRYLEIITQSAVPLTIYADDLHENDVHYVISRNISSNLDAICELVALYEANALEVLEKLLSTEAGGFMWVIGDTLYGTVYARCQADRDATTTPVAVLADDGTGKMYVGMEAEWDGAEIISEARVSSEGDYADEDEESIIWSLSPVPITIPASTTLKLRAPYSAPAKKCWLSVATANSGSWPMDGSDFAGLYRKNTTYPPTTTYVGLAGTVGQALSWVGVTPSYYKYRSYLREPDTADIPDGDTPTLATLRLKITGKFTPVAWTLEVRQPAGSPYDWSPIDTGDWRATPGSDTLIGSVASSAFPSAGEWLEIALLTANINKTGVTAMYLLSSRDRLDSTPTTREYITFSEAELVVEYENIPAVTQVFTNYGAGADIELTAGAVDTVVPTVEVKGIPYGQGAEESLVTDTPASPPDIPNPLDAEMPYQGTRTADMLAEADRLATRYGNVSVDRLPLYLEEQDADSLAQMQERQINDLITLKNVKWDHATKINGNFLIEGVEWAITDQSKILTATFRLEQK